MNFEGLRAVAGSENLAELLYDQVQERLAELPLAGLCEKGGWPLNEKIGTIAVLEDSPARIHAVLYVSFTETGAACCSGDNFEHERYGELSLIIDKNDWIGTVGPIEK